MKTDCAVLGSHHSKDRVTVHCGRENPYRLCGFHASQFGPKLAALLAASETEK
jgi:hypothetical protein